MLNASPRASSRTRSPNRNSRVNRYVHVEVTRGAQVVVPGVAEFAGGIGTKQARVEELIEESVRRAGIGGGRDDVRPVVADAGQRVILAAGGIDGEAALIPDQRGDVPMVQKASRDAAAVPLAETGVEQVRRVVGAQAV